MTFDIESSDLAGLAGAGIAVSTSGSGGAQGYLIGNAIGTSGVAGSGSTAGDGINLQSQNGGSLAVEADLNHVYGVSSGSGIDALDSGGSTLQFTFKQNVVTMPSSGAANAVTVTESGASAGDVCVNPLQNSLSAGGAPSDDLALAQQTATGVFAIDAYDSTGIGNFIDAGNNLAHGAAGVSATTLGDPMTAGTCTDLGTHTI